MSIVPRNQVTVYDLHNAARVRSQRQHECFNLVNERCYARIKKCASVHRKSCVFEVPDIILGKPLYDVDRCTRLLIGNLEGNGFAVTYIFPRSLAISWDLQLQRAAAVAAAPAFVGMTHGMPVVGGPAPTYGLATQGISRDGTYGLATQGAGYHSYNTGPPPSAGAAAGQPPSYQSLLQQQQQQLCLPPPPRPAFRPITEFKKNGKFSLSIN